MQSDQKLGSFNKLESNWIGQIEPGWAHEQLSSFTALQQKIEQKLYGIYLSFNFCVVLQISAISKVVRPASAYRSTASTVASCSILPQPPLVCHIPLITRHISSESFPFVTIAFLLSSVKPHWNRLETSFCASVPFQMLF